MRQFLSVLFLAWLSMTITLVSSLGSALTTAAAIFHQYWKRCATLHDNKYAVEDTTEVPDPNPKWLN